MPPKNAKILIITKIIALKKQLKNVFGVSDYQTTWLDRLDRVLKYFEANTFDLLLISGEACKSGAFNFRDILGIISKESPRTQIILLVREKDIGLAMEGISSGGYQYIRIPATNEEIRIVSEKALAAKPNFGQNKMLREDESVYRFKGFIGRSPVMQTVYRQIEQVAPTGIPVLLLGETGTGKDLAAQAIHHLSPKKEGHYIPVNLGALPSELVASELFGHEKGSFTGASQQHKGVFETASDGTVFLDEIESINSKVQISLLRLIEQKKFTRLGGRRSIHTDARIIAASNEDIEKLVERGKFREDLYFRLDVFRITMPPLRDRTSDISLLAEELVAKFNHELNRNIIRINPNCVAALEEYDWPGNVRELKNILQRSVLTCEEEEICEEHLPKRLRRNKEDPTKIIIEIGNSLGEVEKKLIEKTLSHTRNNRKKAAELLGITRRALYNKLDKHKIS